jgi:hypothetical protein
MQVTVTSPFKVPAAHSNHPQIAHLSAGDKLAGNVISRWLLSAINPVMSRFSSRLNPLSIRGCRPAGLPLLSSPLLHASLTLLLWLLPALRTRLLLPGLLLLKARSGPASRDLCCLLECLKLALGAGQKKGPCSSTSTQPALLIDMSPRRRSKAAVSVVCVKSLPSGCETVGSEPTRAAAVAAAERSCCLFLRFCLPPAPVG